MSAVRLGLILAARTWRSSLRRTVAMALGMIVTGLVAAAALGIPAIFDGLGERTRATSTRDDPSSSLWIDVVDEGVGARTLHRVVVAGTADGVPGSRILPAPGEIVVSPALRQAIATDPLVAARFPQPIVGTIGHEGLIEPGEWRAYVGVADDPTYGRQAFDTRGTSPAAMNDVVGSAEAGRVMIGALLFLGVPAAVFLAVAARLSARARDRRLASLRLIGLSARSVRLVNGVETGLVAAVGSAVGVLAWRVLQPPLGRFGVAGFRWFATDAMTSLPTAAAIVGCSTALAAIVATVSANAAIDSPLATRRTEASRQRLAWRAAVLVVGVGGLVAISVRDQLTGGAALALVVSGALAAAGVTLAAPLFAAVLGLLLAARARRAGTLLLAGRLRHDRAAAGRVLSGLLFATFVVGTAQGVTGAFADVAPDADASPVRSVRTHLERGELLALPGVDVALPFVRVGEQSNLVATCTELKALLALALPECQEGRPHELVLPFSEPFTDYTPLIVDPAENSSMFTGVVLPPSHPDAAPTDAGPGGWEVRVDPARLEQFNAALAGADPRAFAGNWQNDDGLRRLVSAVVVAGAVAAFGIGIAAVVVAAADHALERRVIDANLLALGAPGQLMRRLQFAATAVPIAGSILFAAVIGVATGHIYRRLGNDWSSPPLPWGDAVVCSVVGLTGAVVAGALAWSFTRTRISLADLRTE